MLATPKAPLQMVQAYYRAIDCQDLDAVIHLFHDDARYERAGWPVKVGRMAIERFFREERQLRGMHSLADFIENRWPARLTGRIDIPAGPSVLTHGTFAGTREHEPIELHFEDFWVFDSTSWLVIFRWSDTSVPGA